MIHRLFPVFILSFIPLSLSAQDDLPFREIPNVPESYSAATVAARMVDALGFRYHWATDSLTKPDLDFRPAEDARTCRETIEHIYFLVHVIHNAHFGKVTTGVETSAMSVKQLRSETLAKLEEVRNFLTENEPDQANMDIKFPEGSLSYWYVINGPLSDALYHTGQVVMLRRMSGNPVRAGVDVLTGTVNF